MQLPYQYFEDNQPPSTQLSKLQAKLQNQFLDHIDSIPMTDQQLPNRQAQAAINDLLNELRDLAPALTTQNKVQIYDIIGPLDQARSSLNQNPDPLFHSQPHSVGILDIGAIESQYLLVEHIRATVLNPDNTLKHKSSARELTSLTNAISSLVSLYLRNQDKITLLKQVQSIKQAVSNALKDAPPHIKQNFVKSLKEYENG